MNKQASISDLSAPDSIHTLIDTCTGEGYVSFAVFGTQVEVAESSHPDLPVSVKVVSREEARSIWRRCVKLGLAVSR